MLDKAIQIATNAHQGQIDKAGQPYILHPLRAMFSRKAELERICAVLHDVIEDTDITFEDLKNEGFSDEVLSVLDALTKRDSESYDDFIGRVIENRTACYVKLADISDNMDLTRIENPSPKDYERIERYRRAAARIIDSLKKEGDSDFNNTRKIEVNCCVSVPSSSLGDEFSDKFIDFIERNHCTFDGDIKLLE